MKTKVKKVYSYSVFYELATEGGYIAHVPILPGCHTQGETLEETEKNIKDAIEIYISSLIDHGEYVPTEQKSFQGIVSVPMNVMA